MRTDAGVSHADHWQAAHHRHRGYHGYPPEADQQLVHPPLPLCVGVKGGLAKGEVFFLPFPNLKLLSVMKYERNGFTFLVCDDICFFFLVG